MNRKIILRNVFAGILLVCGVLFSGNVNAQLTVTHGTSLGMTPDSLVREVFLGQGVKVSNVKFNNSAGTINCNAIGTFTATGQAATKLGLNSGIIIGTGDVNFAAGPNSTGGGDGNSGAASCVSQNCVPLMNAASGSIADCSVLEFDFVPSSDSVKFRYVFASEEYPEYVCANVNDIFAFFITGPNPTGGPNYNNKNIALVPGTDTVISINTVNPGAVGANGSASTDPCVLGFSQYYVDNTGGQQIQYDGLTTVLTAEAEVFPCQQYHLIIAIADGGSIGSPDHVYDSGVFLEANSLSSNGISFNFTNPSNVNTPSDLYEGCSAVINLTRSQAMPNPTPIDIFYYGTAVNGVDFEIKNVGQAAYFFPADTTRATYTILPYVDGEDEGIETAMFLFRTYETCPADTVQFNILDVSPLSCRITRDTLTSSTYSTTLTAAIEGGMPNRLAEWRNLENGQVRYGESITVPTTTDTRWALYVHDSCGSNGVDTMLIGIRRQFAFPFRDTVICADEPLDLYMRFLHDTLPDSCVWYRGTDPTPFELQADTVHLRPQESAMYYIHSYVTWNGQIWEDVDSIRVVVVPLPEVHVSASTERLCLGASTNLTGTGAYQYSWNNTDSFAEASTYTFVPDTTTMFYLYGKTAGADCYGKDSVLIVVDTMPVIKLGDGGGVCGGEEAELSAEVTAESFRWSASPADPSLGGQETRSTILVNPASTTVYTLTAVNGVCTGSESVTVAVEPMPVAIGEVSPRTVSLGQMEAVFKDLSQNSTTRRWEFPDGEVSTEREAPFIVPDDVDSVSVKLWAFNPYECFDTTTVTVYVDHTTLWVPNAFTPDESTNNTFLVKMNDIQRYHIFIYDRSGVLVFESLDPEKPWDGTGQNGQKCPQGVYTYLISCHKITYPYDQIVKKGTVLLLR